MSSGLTLWLIVIVMVAVAIIDDIFLRRSLGPRGARIAAMDIPADESETERDRAMSFGSDGNNERILGTLQSLYIFR